MNTFRLEIRKIYFIFGILIRIMAAENLIAFKRALYTFEENIL